MRQSISAEALGALVAAGGVRDVMVLPGPEGTGWQIQVRYCGGSKHYPLRSRRELIRVFRSLDSLNRYVKSLGIQGYSVEL